VTPPSVVVNGRFLGATPTGLHRTARSLLDAAVDGGLDAEVAEPGGRVPGHVWEQAVLPRVAGGRVVLSLANTGPLAARRSMVVVHDLAPLVGPHWFRPAMAAYGRAVLATAKRADAVATVSHQVAGELADAGVRAPITVVRPAVDPGFARPPAADVAGPVARPGRADLPYLLVVGWADPRKDAVTAALAHRIAAADRPHRLVLAGLPHRNFATVEVPPAPSIRMLGYLPEDDLRCLLAGAAALVYPSRYEGFGLPPLEAWACGTPAIVGDTPALRESTEGRATYVAPGDVTALADAMVAALDGDLAVPAPPAWTWTDAAEQLLAAMP
jgi:glycosyltransferase involved in cell wall biosynthesis